MLAICPLIFRLHLFVICSSCQDISEADLLDRGLPRRSHLRGEGGRIGITEPTVREFLPLPGVVESA